MTVPEFAAGALLLDFLDRHFARVGRAEWRRRIAAGAVRSDRGESLGADWTVRARERIRYRREVALEPAIPFAEAILFQDERLLVADKPHFLPVTPSGPWVNECLLYRLMRRTDCGELIPLHRLDRETAGLVLFSKDPGTRAAYGALFMKGRVAKRYEAIAAAPRDGRAEWGVEGRVEKGEPWFRMRVAEGAVNARTRIRLLETCGAWGRFGIEPLTGKQHQIRLHMAAIGCPIANDWLYPELQPEPKRVFETPLLLLARELEFTDPVTGETRVFRSGHRLDWPSLNPADESGGTS
ncbi:MAG: pseudouridine synthase [Kiritimatiellia bacterium]